MRVKIASRKSELARIQALTFGQKIKEKNPDVEVDFYFRESLGDKNLSDPLWKMPERGVFTEDFYKDLVDGKFDMVVHSWKDLPTEERPETEIFATLEREDMRDLLLFRRDRLKELMAAVAKGGEGAAKIQIFSSSPRREYNLSPFLKKVLPFEVKDLKFHSVRGNVQTRIRKLLNGDESAGEGDTVFADGLIVAKAGLDRLLSFDSKNLDIQFLSQLGDYVDEEKRKDWLQGFQATQAELREALSRLNWMVLPLRGNPCAAAQGALACEIRRDREDLKELLMTVHDSSNFEMVHRERDVLRSFGGGCHQKIGVSILKRDYGTIEILRGETDQEKILRADKIDRSKELGWPKAERSNVFPLDPKEAQWYMRREMTPFLQDGEDLHQVLSENDIWVSKAEALTCNEEIETKLASNFESGKDSNIIWSSGLKSWERLANRGLWINGSAEGLGEAENENVEVILGRKPSWIKLTHSRGNDFKCRKTVSTYELIEKENLPYLAGKTHFYWMSGSSFSLAAERFPEEIRNGFHACGPGHTFDFIKKFFSEARSRLEKSNESKEENSQVAVFLSHDEWLKEILKS